MHQALLNILGNNRSAYSVANAFRRSRGKLFKTFLKNFSGPVQILDLGGEENFWIRSELSEIPGLTVTLLNVQKEPVTLPHFKSIAGDARNLAQFPDKSFDIVFSNSVIEHVGTFENQKQMAREIARVGRSYFVQTPNRGFPVEPHFLFPFFWQLPESAQLYLATHIKLGWYPKQPDSATAREFLKNFTLLNEAQVRSLFPSATIEKERFFGLTKSFIALKAEQT